jgi:hypothetical protein
MAVLQTPAPSVISPVWEKLDGACCGDGDGTTSER